MSGAADKQLARMKLLSSGVLFKKLGNLYCCCKCPARSPLLLVIEQHCLGHGAGLVQKCNICDFSNDDVHLLAEHLKLHYCANQEMPPVTNDFQTSPSKLDAGLFFTLESSLKNNNNSNNSHCLETNELWKNVNLSKNFDDSKILEYDSNSETLPESSSQEYLFQISLLIDNFTSDSEFIYCKSDNAYHCCKCPTKAFNIASIKYHMECHGAKLTNKCNYCDFSCNSFHSLGIHHEYHKQRPKKLVSAPFFKNGFSKVGHSYKCLQCPAVFWFPTSARRHSMCHGAGKEFKCSLCDYSTTRKKNYEMHSVVHNNESPDLIAIKPLCIKFEKRKYKKRTPVISDFNKKAIISVLSFKCSKCPAIIPYRYRMETHWACHGSIGRFKCDYCDYAVNKQDCLKSHHLLHESPQDFFTNGEEILFDNSTSNPSLLNRIRLAQKSQGKRAQFSTVKRKLKQRLLIKRKKIKKLIVQPAAVENPNIPNIETPIIVENKVENLKRVIDTEAKTPNENTIFITPVKNFDKFYFKIIGNSSSSSKNIYQCKGCPARSTLKMMLRHVPCHGAQKRFICLHCDFSTVTSKNLVQHFVWHGIHLTDPDEIKEILRQCRLKGTFAKSLQDKQKPAKKITPKANELNVSQIDYDALNETIESVVNQEYVSEPSLMQTSTPLYTLIMRTRLNTPVYQCSKCPTVTFLGRIIKHITFHGANNKFVCSYCDFSSNYITNLKGHMRVHENSMISKKKLEVPLRSVKVKRIKKVVPLIVKDLSPITNESKLEERLIENQEKVTETYSKQLSSFIITNAQAQLFKSKAMVPYHLIKGSNHAYQCHNCPQQVKGNLRIKLHSTCHGSVGNFHCSLCDYANNTRKSFLKHLKSHESLTTMDLSSSDTNSPCKLVSELNSDLITQEKLLPVPQEEKNETYSSTCVESSIEICKTSPIVPINNENSIKTPFYKLPGANPKSCQYQCSKCPLRGSLFKLERHKGSHGCNRRYACSLCDYSCLTMLKLGNHLLWHRRAGEQIPKENLQNDVMNNDSSDFQIESTFLNVSRVGKKKSTKRIKIPREFRRAFHKVEGKTKYRCNKCPVETTFVSLMIRHLANHGTGKKYRCDYCDYAIDEVSHLRRHMNLHQESGENTLEQSKISKDFKNSSGRSLNESVQSHPVVSDSQKLSVSLTSNDEMDLSNNNGDKYIATNIQFNKAATASIREIDTPTGRILACTNCPAQAIHGGWLSRHILCHGVDRKFKCNYCDYSTEVSTNIHIHHKLHILSKQKTVIPRAIIPSGPKKLEASNKFHSPPPENFNKSLLKNVIQKPDSEISTTLIYLKNKSGKIRQMRIPSHFQDMFKKIEGTNNYTCNLCPLKTPFLAILLKHLVCHGAVRRYKCQICNYAIQSSKHFKQHISLHKQMQADQLYEKTEETTTSVISEILSRDKHDVNDKRENIERKRIDSHLEKNNSSLDKHSLVEESKCHTEGHESQLKENNQFEEKINHLKESNQIKEIKNYLEESNNPLEGKDNYLEEANSQIKEKSKFEENSYLKVDNNYLEENSYFEENKNIVEENKSQIGENYCGQVKENSQIEEKKNQIKDNASHDESKSKVENFNQFEENKSPLKENYENFTLEKSNKTNLVSDYKTNIETVGRAYQCTKCPAFNKNFVKMKIHGFCHGSQRRYCCNYCDYSIDSRKRMNQHKLLHNKELAVANKIDCIEKLDESNDLTNIGSAVHCDPTSEIATSLASCHLFNKRARNTAVLETALESIEQTSLQNEPLEVYNNFTIGYKKHPFIKKQNYNLHCSSNKKYQCKSCDYSTNRRGCYYLHVKMHKNNELSYNYCSSDGKSEDLIDTSVNFTECDNLRAISGPRKYFKVPTRINLYQCKLCPAAMRGIGRIKVHSACHGDNRKFKCDYCNYTTSARHNMDTHIQLHKNKEGGLVVYNSAIAKGIKGDVEMWSLSRDRVRRKLKKEHDTNEMQSKLIDGSYGEGKSLSLCKIQPKNKMETHIKFIPSFKWINGSYQCSECPYKISVLDEILRHCSTHEGLKQFVCYHCQFSSNDFHTLKQHAIISHLIPINDLEIKASESNSELNVEVMKIKTRETDKDSENKLSDDIDHDDISGKEIVATTEVGEKFCDFSESKLMMNQNSVTVDSLPLVVNFETRKEKDDSLNSIEELTSKQALTTENILIAGIMSSTEENCEKHVIPFSENAESISENKTTNQNDPVESIIAPDLVVKPQSPKRATFKKVGPFFHCSDCPTKVTLLLSIKHHITYHGAKARYCCIFCNFSVDKSYLLEQHVGVHSNQMSDSLNGCIRTVKNCQVQISKEIDSHLDYTKIAKEFMYQCGQCPLTCQTIQSIELHLLLTHSLNKSNKCIYCTYSTDSSYLLKLHSKLHEKHMDLASNQLCTDLLAKKLDAEYQLKSNASLAFCDGVSKLENLNQINNIHQTENVPSSLLPFAEIATKGTEPQKIFTYCLITVDVYQCKKCPAIFSGIEKMLHHVSLHGSQHQHQCIHCDYSVNFFTSFQQHMKLHAGTKAEKWKSKYIDKCEALNNEISSHGQPYEQNSTHLNSLAVNKSIVINMVPDDAKIDENHDFDNPENLEKPDDLFTIGEYELVMNVNKSNSLLKSQIRTNCTNGLSLPNISVDKHSRDKLKSLISEPVLSEANHIENDAIDSLSKQKLVSGECDTVVIGSLTEDVNSHSVYELNSLNDKNELQLEDKTENVNTSYIRDNEMEIDEDPNKLAKQILNTEVFDSNLIGSEKLISDIVTEQNVADSVMIDLDTAFSIPGVSVKGTTFSCLRCPFTSSTKNSILSHLRGHFQRFLYRCSYCNYSTDLSNILETHVQFHFTVPKETVGAYLALGEGDIVRKEESIELDRHSISRGGKIIFICSYCDREFSEEDSFCEHEMLHLNGLTPQHGR